MLGDWVGNLLIKAGASVVWKGIFWLTSCLFRVRFDLCFNSNLVPSWLTIIFQNVDLCIFFQMTSLRRRNLTHRIFLRLGYLGFRLHNIGFWDRNWPFRLDWVMLLVFFKVFNPSLNTSFCWWGVLSKLRHLPQHLQSLHASTGPRKFQSRLFLDFIIFASSSGLNIDYGHNFIFSNWRGLDAKGFIEANS